MLTGAEADALFREGTSSTPLDGKISKTGDAPFVIKGAGIDEIRFTVSVSGDAARVCESLSEHTWKPKGMPGVFFLGHPFQDGYRRSFNYLLGRDDCRVMYHRDSATLHVRVHFPELASVPVAHVSVLEAEAQLAEQGIDGMAPQIARADFTADVIFRNEALYRYAHSAFANMLAQGGRVVHPVKHSLYLYASKAAKSKRCGRVYDKGRELHEVHHFDLPANLYMRIEAEQHFKPRLALDALQPELARSTFLDRWEAVGAGTLSLKGNLVEPLMELRTAGTISASQFERLYAFLDMCRMGLAERLYAENRDLYLARTREARKLGLEVPGMDDRSDDSIEQELDVRALVREASLAF